MLLILLVLVYFLLRTLYSHFFFFFNDTATTEIYTLSLHDALPISHRLGISTTATMMYGHVDTILDRLDVRSEEHTSELQSRLHLVCRLLLEKKKKTDVDDWIAGTERC